MLISSIFTFVLSGLLFSATAAATDELGSTQADTDNESAANNPPPSSFDRIDASPLDLPTSHLPYLLHGLPSVVEHVCANEPQCVRQLGAELRRHTTTAAVGSIDQQQLPPQPCWGYELGCRPADRFAAPAICRSDEDGPPPPPRSEAAALNDGATFFDQADFGYVREQRRELLTICEARRSADSSLECSPHLRFCRARGIRVDFRRIAGGRTDEFRYRTDVLAKGAIGGRCRLHGDRLAEHLDHMSALQSWAPELRSFVEDRPAEQQCDEWVERPTYFLKIDATFNMYHHFCDLFNFYATLHVNGTHPAAFGTDVELLVWETYPYRSPFAAAWRAFSRHPVRTLRDVRGRVVCYRNLVLPLLPRMIFGLYYNTPLIKNCANSGLFAAFSEHLLHRLRIPLDPPTPSAGDQPRLRITVLARQTKYRNILNIHELVAALRANPVYSVRLVSYERMDFAAQLRITRNTDVFVGMHGAGLTHLLFLPQWAALFEVYNCDDEACYRDLARLRGVGYVTWERPDLLYRETADGGGGAAAAGQEYHHHAGTNNDKFTNYRFDRAEFVRLVGRAAALVREHDGWQKYSAGFGGSGAGDGGVLVGSGHQSDEL